MEILTPHCLICYQMTPIEAELAVLTEKLGIFRKLSLLFSRREELPRFLTPAWESPLESLRMLGSLQVSFSLVSKSRWIEEGMQASLAGLMRKLVLSKTWSMTSIRRLIWSYKLTIWLGLRSLTSKSCQLSDSIRFKRHISHQNSKVISSRERKIQSTHTWGLLRWIKLLASFHQNKSL